MAKYHFLVLANITSFGACSFVYADSLTRDIKDNVKAINEGIKTQKSTDLQAFKQITNFVQLHSAAKQLSDKKTFFVM